MMRHSPTEFAPWEKRDHGMQPPIISEQGQAVRSSSEILKMAARRKSANYRMFQLVMWIGVALSCTFVAIRTHAQYRNSRRLFINDYCIFFCFSMSCRHIYCLSNCYTADVWRDQRQCRAEANGVNIHAAGSLLLEAPVCGRYSPLDDPLVGQILAAILFLAVIWLGTFADEAFLVDHVWDHGVHLDHECNSSGVRLRPHRRLLYTR